MDLGTRLLTWRTHLGLTLQVVAARAGVGHPLVSKIESGFSNVRVVNLTLIVTKGLRMTMATFFGPVPKVRFPTTRVGRPRKPFAGARAA